MIIISAIGIRVCKETIQCHYLNKHFVTKQKILFIIYIIYIDANFCNIMYFNNLLKIGLREKSLIA